MRLRILIASLAAAVLQSLCDAAASPAVAGEILVRYHSETARRGARTALAEDAAARRYPLDGMRRLDGRPVERVRVPGRDAAELAAEYARRPEVESATPNFIRRIQRASMPDDSRFREQWGLLNTGQTVNAVAGVAGADIRAPWAWPLSRAPTQALVIAVIDTGVDYRHPDLADAVWVNPGEDPDSGRDDDGNGYTNDVHGYDFSGAVHNPGGGTVFRLPPGPDPMDGDGHGTHVAGIAAAVANNSLGIAGVADARIMALKASPDGDEVTLADSLEAIAYAVRMKTDFGVPVAVISAAYGEQGGYSEIERDAIIAAGDAGIVFCAAAGNSGSNNDVKPFYPASYRISNIVVAAASDQRDRRPSFSNYGAESVDLAAPGVNILSCRPLWADTRAALTQPGVTNFAAGIMEFSGFTGGLTATVHDCGRGHVHEFPSAVTGNIALIERGGLFFYEKIANAMQAGAAAAVIYNNDEGPFEGTLIAPSDWIPSVTVSRADGLAILGKTLPVTLTLAHTPLTENAYVFKQGTSMATAFVAGAIAFMARQFPADTPPQRIRRLLDHVDVLPDFAGRTTGGGRLNLQRAVDGDADGLPDWWEIEWAGDLESMDADSDYSGDGFSDMHAFLAGSDPTVPGAGLRLTAIEADGGQTAAIVWNSAEDRVYRVLGATGANPDFQVRATNLPATPPLNSWTDTSEDGESPRFYRIELESFPDGFRRAP